MTQTDMKRARNISRFNDAFTHLVRRHGWPNGANREEHYGQVTGLLYAISRAKMSPRKREELASFIESSVLPMLRAKR